MDALKIALETVLVGALALPWLWLGLHLFAPDAKSWLQDLPSGDDGIRYGIAAVLAVAMAYTVGAAVSRLAQDFYNDSDVGLPLPPQSSIRASIFCDDTDGEWIIDPGVDLPGNPPEASIKNLCCQRKTCHGKERKAAILSMQQIFRLEESATLLLGEDKTSQIRHLHQQLVVLQGVGFDGLITWTLCVLAWNAEKAPRNLRKVLPVGLLVYFFFYALLWNHMDIHRPEQIVRMFHRWIPNDPPFMELCGLLLAVAGLCLAWKPAVVQAPKPVGIGDPEPTTVPSYRALSVISFLLTAIAYCGWYWTEILYDRLVINSYYASHHLLKSLS